jgi:hypothetical protein
MSPIFIENFVFKNTSCFEFMFEFMFELRAVGAIFDTPAGNK